MAVGAVGGAGLECGSACGGVLLVRTEQERAKALHRELLYDGVRVDSINAAQTHAVRSAAVENFRCGRRRWTLAPAEIAPADAFVRRCASWMGRGAAISGRREDGDGCARRDACVTKRRAGRTWVLVATDLVGRGMDFVGVRTVVNYDFPSSTADYIHRVGRTGRAAQTGAPPVASFRWPLAHVAGGRWAGGLPCRLDPSGCIRCHRSQRPWPCAAGLRHVTLLQVRPSRFSPRRTRRR